MKKVCIVVVLLVNFSHAQLKLPIGQTDFSDWTGISKVKNDVATFKSGATIAYQYANQNREYPGLMRDYFGDAADWSVFEGMLFDIYLEQESSAELTLTLKVDTLDVNELNAVSTAKIQLVGKGWQSVYVPWDMFDVAIGQKGATLQAIKNVEITANSKENKTFQIQNLFVTKGEYVSLESKIQGQSVAAGNTVFYELEVGNTTNKQQGIQLVLEQEGWESMQTIIEPQTFKLAAGEIKTCKVEVFIPEFLPQGIREKQVIKAISNGKGAATATLEYFTAVAIATPNIVFTAEKWQEVKDKIENYNWAKEGLEDYEKKARNWQVPEGKMFTEGNKRQQIFHKGVGDDVFNCAIAYELTGKEEYARKCLKMLRRLVNPENGYPVTLRGGGDSFVAEGGFFQGVARAYDLVRNSELFTPEDHELIANTFRIFAERTIKGNTRGGISNWNVAELTGALYCALNLQDWHLISSLLNSPSGIYQQMTHGIMSDGWWYECAVGYNLWVASEFSEIAIALEPWGINLVDRQFPIGTTAHFSLNPSRRTAGLHGMDFKKWGTLQKNNVSIKDMWDAVVPFLDYRSVLPAVNDAKEDLVTGKPYELAYYLYRDPEYAAVINRGDKRDLLYGVPDLPDVTSEKMTLSAFADNIGLVQLRTQTEDRPQREQIQAALHYGSHGGHHGHFDRMNFVSMMRYGRSFYNPEMFWYGYASYLYKFLVQTSINKNMVVVDQKMQEPKESFRTFYYTGEMMQATAVETTSRWSNPPYGGMTYESQKNKDFSDKTWKDSRSIEIPEHAPEYGTVTEFTEPIKQRRLMIMMDDYVVLADYLKADKEHTFDWLMQVKGFKEIVSAKTKFKIHENQMNSDPLGSAQFITDCNWYETEGTARTSFEMCWGDHCDNEGARMPFSEEGSLKIDVFNAWPKQNEIMIGTAPESFGVNKKLWYNIEADNTMVVTDSTGAWILGSKIINTNIEGAKKLVLSTKTETNARNNTIFWGDARVVLKDGSEVYLSSLPVVYANILQPKTEGLDYYNGPIKIAGEPMEKSTPGMPDNKKDQGTITVDLSGLEVVSFKAKIGGDFPLGDETQRRKTMAVRQEGKEARYLSVIEPFENQPFVKSVTAKSENQLTVELVDGRTQNITISELEGDGKNIKVAVKEYFKGKLVREEHSFREVLK